MTKKVAAVQAPAGHDGAPTLSVAAAFNRVLGGLRKKAAPSCRGRADCWQTAGLGVECAKPLLLAGGSYAGCPDLDQVGPHGISAMALSISAARNRHGLNRRDMWYDWEKG